LGKKSTKPATTTSSSFSAQKFSFSRSSIGRSKWKVLKIGEKLGCCCVVEGKGKGLGESSRMKTVNSEGWRWILGEESGSRGCFGGFALVSEAFVDGHLAD
jgi:hypothetical protein